MARQSAGILVYRHAGRSVEVFLVHPGGPYWAKKDNGAWSVPKGETEPDEDLLTAAKREFSEETGKPVPEGAFIDLGSFTRNAKEIFAWAVEGDVDATGIVSNTLQIAWPPGSGKQIEIPEIDRAAWVDIADAPRKMHTGQDIFIRRLMDTLLIDVKEPPQLTLL